MLLLVFSHPLLVSLTQHWPLYSQLTLKKTWALGALTPDTTTTTLSPTIENLCKHCSLSSIAWHPHSQIQLSIDCVTLCMHAKSLRSYLTLCDPVGCSPPGSSVQGILQARVQKWVAMPSRGSSWSRDRTHVSYIYCTNWGKEGLFTASVTWEACVTL